MGGDNESNVQYKYNGQSKGRNNTGTRHKKAVNSGMRQGRQVKGMCRGRVNIW